MRFTAVSENSGCSEIVAVTLTTGQRLICKTPCLRSYYLPIRCAQFSHGTQKSEKAQQFDFLSGGKR
jgi:hypothetical protein